MSTHARQRGFTVIELVVVVGIVGLLTSLAVFNVTRNRDTVQMSRSVASLRAEVERARALARTAGSRLGTARVQYGPGCAGAALPGSLLWVSIDPGPGTVLLPRALRYDEPTDTLQLTCAPWDFGGARGAAGEANFIAPAAPVVFGFASNGRLAFPDGVAPVNVFVQLRHASGETAPGFRVLPAGVTCISSNPAPFPDPCDEDFP